MPEPLILRANDGHHRMVIEYDYEGQEIYIEEQVYISKKERYGIDTEYNVGVSVDEKFLPQLTCWLIQLCKELQPDGLNKLRELLKKVEKED